MQQESISIKRMKKLFKVKHGDRVKTPKGEGFFCYSENRKLAVIELDERYHCHETGMNVKNVYVNVEDMEVL